MNKPIEQLPAFQFHQGHRSSYLFIICCFPSILLFSFDSTGGQSVSPPFRGHLHEAVESLKMQPVSFRSLLVDGHGWNQPAAHMESTDGRGKRQNSEIDDKNEK
jgi:hypothetical protein